MSTSIENTAVEYVIIGQMVYGKGETLTAAWRAFTASGGSVRKPHTIIDFSHPAVRFTGISAMGDVFWESDDEDVEPGVTHD